MALSRWVLLPILVLPVSTSGGSLLQSEPDPKFLADVGSQCEDLSAQAIRYGLTYEVPGSGLPGDPIDVHDLWLAGGCVGCHNGAALGDLRLDQPANGGYELIWSPSFRNPELLLVQPGEPENSLLYTMLNCSPPLGYLSMPPGAGFGSQRIAADLRARLYDWIEQGARGFDEDGNPYSDIVFRDQLEGNRRQRLLTPPSTPVPQ